MFSFLRRRQSPPATDGSADAAPPASLGERLQRTGSRFRRGLLSALTGRQQLDEDTLELLENELLMADVGVPTTQAIVEALSKASITEADGGARGVLRRVLLEQLAGVSQPLEIPDSERPFVILVVGVNGSGKTTTIGKLARQLQNDGVRSMHSLSGKWDEDDQEGTAGYGDLLEDANAECPLGTARHQDMLDELTRSLSDRDRFIITQYYEEGRTLREIGEKLDLTESRVCQIHANVMDHLRVRFGARQQTLLM